MVRIAVTSSMLVLMGALCAACAPPPPEEGQPGGQAGESAPPEAAVQRARDVSDALVSDLMSALVGQLEQGGAAAAVKVCSEMAPAIAAEHSGEGVVVRRVSLRLRNPANAPDAYERRILESMQANLDAGGEPEEVARVVEGPHGKRELRFMRPIRVAEPCLQCHGAAERIDAGVQAVLRQRYPQDEAVSYEKGDLRGAVSVTVELER